jgi:hypothetical protein
MSIVLLSKAQAYDTKNMWNSREPRARRMENEGIRDEGIRDQGLKNEGAGVKGWKMKGTNPDAY